MKYTDHFRIYLHHMQRLSKMSSFSLKEENLVYQCPLNYKKRHNLAIQQISKSFLPRWEVSLPHILHVGVTTRCNLLCPACPTGTNSLVRPAVDIDFDLYARMVDSLRGSLLLMLFWDWGEPFLHSRFIDMIAHAKKSHIKTIISTNGNISYTRKKIEALVSLQPDTIIICVDGATQETYKKYRVGGKLSSVLATAERFLQVKEKTGSQYPIVEFRTVINKHTENELPQIFRIAEDIGVDLFSAKSLRPSDHHGHNMDEELVPQSSRLARHKYRTGSPKKEDRINETGMLMCGKPMYAPFLASGGDLLFCEHSFHQGENFGNLAKVDFKQLWRSKTARMKRLYFLRNGGTRSCRACYFRYDHKPTILHTVPLRSLPPDISLDQKKPKTDFLNVVCAKD